MKMAKYSQGSTVSCPWSTTKGSLGKPKSMAAEGKQGEASIYKKITQGKFSGAATYEKNLHNAKPQAPSAVAWPNKGTVAKPRVR
jgi:hypothetical protein